MSDLEEGCGCIWGVISAVMVIGGLIYAFSNGSSSKDDYSPSNSTSPVVERPVYTPPPTYKAPVNVEPRVTTRHSFSPDDAYDEGYDEGYSQGEEDGRKGRSHGYGYDDSNDYYNHYETMYCEGYENGYEDGYSSGHSQYQDEEDEED